ncbi:MAG: nitrate- and nitrite sensing domain-containing protein [Mycobacteriales bacterium]
MARPARSWPGFSPRHWRVRSKLIAVLVVPAVAFLVLASINMAGQIGSAREFGRGATIAEFGRQVTTVVHELQAERDLADGFITGGRLPSNQDKINAAIAKNEQIAKENQKLPPDKQKDPVAVPSPTEAIPLEAQQRNVDSALAGYRSAVGALGDVGPQAASRIESSRAEIDGLPTLRSALTRKLLTEGAIIGKYSGMITGLLDVDREIGQRSGNRELSQQVAGLTALADAKETLSQERALLYSVASASEGGRFQLTQAQEFSSAIARRQAALARFRADSSPDQRTQYDELVNGQAVLAVKRLEDTVLRRQGATKLGLDAQQWYSAATTYLQAMREVEVSLLDQVVAKARELRSDAQRQAITTGVVIATILVIAFLTSLLIARSMIGPLRRLQTSARDVAENRLPEAIARLRRTDTAPVPMEVEPIPIDSRDEIGAVATTFDELHREAVRLATEQAALRNNVNAMFVNLSRRSQGLVERQLKLIDELETGEQDPDQLANLFKLDHLATRMRRNSENLLVLAGEDAGRRWGRPIPLVDVLRAATSEVEQYHRIQLTGVPDVEVMGHAVNHVVHLVAEILENATVFSSPESKVLVHSQRLSDGGAMVEIEDRGIGMSAQEIADANERLARPPVFDVSISRMMGLYVVGRLAGRHGITVRLRQSETGGVSAFIRLPVDVLAGRFEQRQDEPVGAGGPSPDGRSDRPGAVMLPPPPAAQPGPPGGLPAGPDPRPGPGPGVDLPRRPLPYPGGGPERPAGPLPRRTPGGDSPGGGGRPLLPAPGAVNGANAGPAQGTNGRPGSGVPPTLGGATRADLSGQPGGAPFGAQPFGAPTTGPYGLPTAAVREERTPIFEQLQSEWFRQRPSSRPPGAPDAPAAVPQAPRHPAAAAAQAAPQPAAVAPEQVPPAPGEDPWASAADEGWRAAERLLQPTSGGTTRAGLPMRVPQAHLMPGGADVPAPPVPPGPPAYRSPEAVRSRLASYHQGVRRGRHADRTDGGGRAGSTGQRDPSEVLVQQSQEQS